MSKVLVTGGAGFIGSHLAEYLLNQGHVVVVIDDLSGGSIDNVETWGSRKSYSGAQKDVTFIQMSILDTNLIDDLFRQHKFDYVYHLAAYAAEGLSHFIKRFNYQNNLIGSVNLINASVNHGVKCFVFTSSMAVYGSNPVPFHEWMAPAPEDSYGIAKAAVEQELAITHRLFGLDYVIFRPHNVIGERQNIGDRYRNVVGIFMNQILKGEPMAIFGDGGQVRAFTCVHDIVPLIAEAPSNPDAIGEIFNLGSDTPFTINQLAQLTAKAMQVEPRVIHVEERSEVRLAYCAHDRAREVFGPMESTPLYIALTQMAEWARKHGARHSKEFEAIEIEKNLPASWRKS